MATGVLVATACGGNGNPPAGEGEKLTSKVYVVGDSTVCSFTDKEYQPRFGYGTQIENYLNMGEGGKVVNLAISGRSSYSFLSETNYSTLSSGITSGDYLIIGFGHNDEKAEVARYTNPNLATDSTEKINERYASFKKTLYDNYIKLATDKGATPILCTPIVRLKTNNSYSSEHVTSTTTVGGVTYAGGDYAQAIRDLGAEKNVTVVDLTTLTKEDYTAKGYDEALNYHRLTTESKTSVDATHTNLYGARMNAYYIADTLKNSTNSLGKYVKSDIAKPDKTASLADGVAAGVANGYVHVDYKAPTGTSSLWTTVTDEKWHGTVFGNLGGSKNLNDTNFIVEQNGDKFTVGAKTVTGKIEGGSDGLAAVYMQLDRLQNFEITVTVKIDKYISEGNNTQSGFGLMLRDDMYVDNAVSVSSNYISAGYYGDATAKSVIYMRKDSKLVNSGNGGTLAEGDTHTLYIKKDNQTFTVKYDDYTEQSMFTDLSLESIDNEYIYLCLYATRGVVATFSNINYVDNGLGVDA